MKVQNLIFLIFLLISLSTTMTMVLKRNLKPIFEDQEFLQEEDESDDSKDMNNVDANCDTYPFC